MNRSLGWNSKLPQLRHLSLPQLSKPSGKGSKNVYHTAINTMKTSYTTELKRVHTFVNYF